MSDEPKQPRAGFRSHFTRAQRKEAAKLWPDAVDPATIPKEWTATTPEELEALFRRAKEEK